MDIRWSFGIQRGKKERISGQLGRRQDGPQNKKQTAGTGSLRVAEHQRFDLWRRC